MSPLDATFELKMHKNAFSWGCGLDPTRGAATPDAWLDKWMMALRPKARSQTPFGKDWLWAWLVA